MFVFDLVKCTVNLLILITLRYFYILHITNYLVSLVRLFSPHRLRSRMALILVAGDYGWKWHRFVWLSGIKDCRYRFALHYPASVAKNASTILGIPHTPTALLLFGSGYLLNPKLSRLCCDFLLIILVIVIRYICGCINFYG